jgi:hypothetical protein
LVLRWGKGHSIYKCETAFKSFNKPQFNKLEKIQ